MPVIQDISVSASLNGNLVTVSQLMGLLDTGASRTVLGQGVVNQLGLLPNDWEQINTPSGSSYACLFSDIEITFTQKNKTKTFKKKVACAGIPYGANGMVNMLIGMDIIGDGLFSVNGFSNSYRLEFN